MKVFGDIKYSKLVLISFCGSKAWLMPYARFHIRYNVAVSLRAKGSPIELRSIFSNAKGYGHYT